MERVRLSFKSNTNGEKINLEANSSYKYVDNHYNLQYFDKGQGNSLIKTTIIYDEDNVLIKRKSDYENTICLNRFKKSFIEVVTNEGILKFDVKIMFMNLKYGRLFFKYQMINNKEVLSEVEIDIKYEGIGEQYES